MMTIMVEYLLGSPINTIQFFMSLLLRSGICFIPLTMRHYALKRGQFSLDLYMNINKSR